MPATTQSEPVHVQDAAEFQELVADGAVLVDFYADWCGPCKMLEPVLETVAVEGPGTVAKVDVDVHQDLARQHGVQGVPTVVLYANGEPVESIVGVRGKDQYVQLLEQYAN